MSCIINRLSSELKSGEGTAAGGSLHLAVNRLSGDIPSSVLAIQDVSLLEGNIFQCDGGATALPEHDRLDETLDHGVEPAVG